MLSLRWSTREREMSYFPPRIDLDLEDMEYSTPSVSSGFSVEHIRDRPYTAYGRVNMPLAFVIEVNSDAVGLAVRDGDQYRFHAVAHGLFHLEGQLFESPVEAERVARQQVNRPVNRPDAARLQPATFSC